MVRGPRTRQLAELGAVGRQVAHAAARRGAQPGAARRARQHRDAARVKGEEVVGAGGKPRAARAAAHGALGAQAHLRAAPGGARGKAATDNMTSAGPAALTGATMLAAGRAGAGIAPARRCLATELIAPMARRSRALVVVSWGDGTRSPLGRRCGS